MDARGLRMAGAALQRYQRQQTVAVVRMPGQHAFQGLNRLRAGAGVMERYGMTVDQLRGPIDAVAGVLHGKERNDALHLRWLSRLAWIVRSPGRLSRLTEASTADEIHGILLEAAAALPASLRPHG